MTRQHCSFTHRLIACALPLALLSASTGAAAAATAPAQVLPLPADWYPESKAFGSRAFGGQISRAQIEGEQIKLQAIVSGLNEASSGAILGGRVYFTESKTCC